MLTGLWASDPVPGIGKVLALTLLYEIHHIDRYLEEQLPNGAFTSNYRRHATSELSKQQFHEILRTGKVNLADYLD